LEKIGKYSADLLMKKVNPEIEILKNAPRAMELFTYSATK
jgi:hypothetical protein